MVFCGIILAELYLRLVYIAEYFCREVTELVVHLLQGPTNKLADPKGNYHLLT